MDNRKYLQLLAVVCLIVLAGAAGAAERSDVGLATTEGYSLTTGLEYASGDYGTSANTDVWQVPVGLGYVRDRFSAGISTAYLNAKSSGTILVTSVSHMTSVSGANVKSASGIGDINMYASYQLPQAKGEDITYHVTGRIKLGIADEKKGLGTGENDFAIEGGFLVPYQKVFVFGNLGYQVTGDSATVNYDDVLYMNAGATYPMQPDRSIGLMLELSQAATPGFDGPAALTLFVNQALEKQRSLYAYVLLGLSDGSPDSGIGVNLTFKL